VTKKIEMPAPRPDRDPRWTQQALQIPIDLAAILRAEAKQKQSGSIKVLGSAAVALLLGMPSDVRDGLAKWVLQSAWDDPSKITPEAAWTHFLEILKEGTVGERYIDRIVDPEVRPKSGQKASDRKKKSVRKTG